ncbi:unnamed protein product [Arabidopsis thaliana]|uniref:Transmembrane protein n=3 Tax=Arabidopsis TaxID=3701 RepID=Q8GWP9_ARATH|nr:uncharacterized protein AT5G57887 [Arabidopsis thaliana]KAG7613388.1 hypothetical protein ISN44_As05g053080 [Arabidopsis suecica]AAO64071.1 unknown protein [Arabidopsis thaliana]AED96967.1 transmembrane protein [Arabidopsis thaliana]CAA0410537.1 unnamed protein product [Arabidopsis thaliana]VYS70701.1 unnamed protein product [Arabidopsis thaliana]|eukprot:NP_680452.1 transmembrane protein [Arabidopsis thaliana]
MRDIKGLLILSIILLLVLSQSLLLCSGHVDHEAGVTRKLGVFIRRRARRFRGHRPTSASITLLSGSFHMTACLATSSSCSSLLF